MSRRTPDKPPKPVRPPSPNERQNGHSNPTETASLESLIGFTRLDWIATALIATVLMIVPIWAATFATPAQRVSFTASAIELEGPIALTLEIWTGPLALILIGAAFCIIMRREWVRPVKLFSVRGLTTALGLLGTWAALTSVRQGIHFLSLNALSYLFGGLLLGGICSRLGRDVRAAGVLTLTIALAGSLIAGIGVREYLGYLRDHVVNHRTFSTFGPDFLAGYLLLTLPLTLSAFAAASDRSLRVLLGLGILLQSGCLFLTGSRAGTGIAVISVLVWIGLALFIGTDRAALRRLAIAAALFVIGSVVSAAPTVMRYKSASPPAIAAATGAPAASERAPDHSSQFRKYTWMGTVRMAMRNPVMGTGIGTFGIAYPRYAETAFTAHAHNSYLQWAAETGFPGALALLTAFAAASAFIVFVLLQLRKARIEQKGETEAVPETKPASVGIAALEPSGLMLAGFVASLVGSTVHNLFDSDLYIIATLLTFCAVFALVIATARSLAQPDPEATQPVHRAYWCLGALAVLFMFARAGQIGFSRWHIAQIGRASGGSEAAEEARAAAAADPFDPEPHFMLASINAQSPDAESQLKEAARVAPSGMTFYLLGRHYREQGQWKQAIEAFDSSLSFEPHNLQTLRALAETQRKAGQPVDARITYQTMTALEAAPYGTVLSMPELIETDYAYAHSGLADLAMEQKDAAQAQQECEKSLKTLRRYWEGRIWLVNDFRAPEKRRALADLYVHTLETYVSSLKMQNKLQEILPVEKELSDVRADIQKDAEKRAAAQAEGSGQR
jgi:O-antigen ligase